MQINVNVDPGGRLQGAFIAAPGIVLDELQTAMGSAMLYLLGQTQERTPTDLNTLREAFITDVTRSELLDAVIGRLNNPLPYALPVEMGTKPHFPPMAPLISWVERKLDLFGDEAEARARAIQRTIGRYGSEPKRMAHRALRAGVSTIEGEFDEAAQRAGARIAALGTPGGAA